MMQRLLPRPLFAVLFGAVMLSCNQDAADLLFDKKIVAPVIPQVINVTSSNANGTYSTGSLIQVQVIFNTTVVVNGTPRLTLNTGNPATTNVNYTSGSGSNTLTFTYTVAALNSNTDLDYTSTTALALNGGTIAGTTGVAATITLPAPGSAGSLGANKNLNIDTTVAPPTVLSVTAGTANGTYGPGSTISVRVQFSSNVTVTGTPQLVLSTGSPTTTAVNYSGMFTADTLQFDYTIVSGNNSGDLDYASTAALVLNGGTIISTSTPNPAAILGLATPGAANSLGANKAIVIDAVVPVITNITSSTTNGSYKAGDSISIQVTFSKNISVSSGTPTLSLNSTGTATYVSVSTNTLTFTYTVAGTETASDLDVTSLLLNGATIADSLGNSANISISGTSLATNKNIVIDTTAPKVSSVNSSTADDVYTVGQVISIQLNFDEPVIITGSPRLLLETGATDANIFCSAAALSTTHNCSYTVSASESSADLDYQNSGALTLNGGTINDAAGNPANLTLVAPGAANSLGANKNIKIDTSAPTVVNITSTMADMNYSVPVNIDIQVVFSKRVNVTGLPELTLQAQQKLVVCTGISLGTWVATPISGSGTNTIVFRVNATSLCSLDLDYQGTSSLANAGGSTIQDLSGINAVLTLFTPGTTGSLGFNKNIRINN
ncbi:MAG: hypothetical protein KF713_20295 [Turneriella sp.]|nr:hypothetical protein [Turneriella sp.]